MSAQTSARPTQAGTRSALYALFAFMFTYPDADWVVAIRAGEVASRMADLCAALAADPPLRLLRPVQPDYAALADAGSAAGDLAVEYTRLFDTGPLSLHGGHHHGARMQVMEEVLRFYEHFGLSQGHRANALPDHLVSELEFMHYLAFREVKCLEAGLDPGAWQRGQRDFLVRQLGRWAPQLHGRLVECQALPYFSEAARLLGDFIAADRARLESKQTRTA